MSPLTDKTIVLGVSGGIAAYKSAELVRLLVTRGARVRVMMTRNAREFITPLTMQTLSSHPVATDTFNLTQESEIGHIQIADTADAIVIAPATADVIAKAAVGIADDLVTTVLLAARCPLAIAPAMNVNMYNHPTVRENLARLKSRSVTIIDPEEGALACGWEGKGRLCEPTSIVDELERMLSARDLEGERILITAGPTQEAIDPVRFISNRSSGKMGFALAKAAWRRGAQVKLVAGPTSLPSPRGVERIDSVSASELLRATSHNFPWCSILIMAAAVADFRPVKPHPHKIKKNARGLALELEGVSDEMPRLAAKKGERLIVGFAAETRDLHQNAIGKLRDKKLDLIVANDVTAAGAGFGVDTNIVTLFAADRRPERHPKLTKDEVADVILDRVAMLRGKVAGPSAKRRPARLRVLRSSN